GEATRKLIEDYGPRGLVERIDASWQGSLGAPDKYQARGRMRAFSIASQPAAAATPAVPAASAASATLSPRSRRARYASAMWGREGSPGGSSDSSAA
ncbi:MAG: hypothetical protein ABUU24_09100, partial [Variovorax sp.]